MKFRPRQIPYDSIIVEGSSGIVTFEALRWLTQHNVPVFMLDYNGSMISSILPPHPLRADLRRAQVQAYSDSEKRCHIARALIEAKLERSGQILDWVYETHDIETELRRFKREAYRLVSAETVDEVRACEGRAADFYWRAWQKTVPTRLEFKSRSTRARNRQNNASDPVNALLNYGYAFLQSYVRRAINQTGLDSSLGFLHEDKPATTPLVYDFEEPFRWLVDITVLKLIESRAFTQDDFYFTAEDYRLRIKPSLLDRYAGSLRQQFNAGMVYGGDRLQWDTVILRKAQELARFLVGRTKRFELTVPQPALHRVDTGAIRDKIRSLTSSEAKKLHGKVTSAKRRKIPSLKRIRTCILVVESLVAERTKRKIFADFAVYVWDWPIVLFLAAKVAKMVSLSKPDRKIKEQKLDPGTTFLQVVNPYKNALKFSVCIFHQRLFKELDREAFQSAIEALTRILQKLADELDLRGYVTLETYSLSGITDDCLESYKKVLEEMSAGRIIYEVKLAKIYAFDTASWSFLLA